MINLLGRPEGLAEAGQKYKGVIHVAATVVAAAYLVAAAGSAGWWVWVGVRKSEVVRERDALVGRVGQLAATEAAVRQVASRVDMVEAALGGPKQGPVLTKIQAEAQKRGLEVISWQEGIVTVRGTNLPALESFAQSWEVKSVIKKTDGVWEEEVIWK